jgi:hypothetical protein
MNRIRKQKERERRAKALRKRTKRIREIKPHARRNESFEVWLMSGIEIVKHDCYYIESVRYYDIGRDLSNKNEMC